MVRCITDAPGPLPGEVIEALDADNDAPPALDAAPAAIDALIEAYDISVLDYQDGTMPSAQLAPAVWADVIRQAQAAGNLRALRVQLGNAWAVASIEVGDACVTITTAPDASRPLMLVDLAGL